MSFPQKILIPLSDQIDTSLIEHKNIFEGEGDRIALANIIDDETKLLLHCDGANGSLLFPDSSKSVHTIAAFGGAEVDTSIKKFGTGSVDLLDGGSYLHAPGNSDFDFAAGDFNLEWQLHSANFNQSSGIFYSTRHVSGFSGILIQVTGRRIRFLATINNTSWDIDFTTNTDLINGQSNHCAISRQGDIYRAFQGGFQRGTQTVSGSIHYANAPLILGGDTHANAWFTGHMDEVRIKKGEAVYTSNFTPPSAAFPTYSDASPSPAAVWTVLPLGAEIDMSTAKCWMFKDGVIQPATNTDVKFKYAANNAALSSTLTLAQLRAESDSTITDDTNSFKAVGVYASDGTYESKSTAWLEVDAIFPEGNGGGLSIINGGIINV